MFSRWFVGMNLSQALCVLSREMRYKHTRQANWNIYRVKGHSLDSTMLSYQKHGFHAFVHISIRYMVWFDDVTACRISSQCLTDTNWHELLSQHSVTVGVKRDPVVGSRRSVSVGPEVWRTPIPTPVVALLVTVRVSRREISRVKVRSATLVTDEHLIIVRRSGYAMRSPESVRGPRNVIVGARRNYGTAAGSRKPCSLSVGFINIQNFSEL